MNSLIKSQQQINSLNKHLNAQHNNMHYPQTHLAYNLIMFLQLTRRILKITFFIMKYDTVHSIKLRHFSINHTDLLLQGLMNIFCPKENISVFHVVNKIKQSTFHYKDTSKVVNGVFFISLVTSDSSGFWKTEYRKSGLITTEHYFGITYCLFFFFNNLMILKKHRECILCMRQFSCPSSKQTTSKTFLSVCWCFGLF